MKVETPYLVAGGVAAVLVLGGLAYWIWGTGGTTDIAGSCTPKDTVEVTAEDFTFGEENAPLVLVEYASQTCSHCGEFRRDVFPQLEENYIKPGLVRFVFREFQRNPIDIAASVLGRCLGRDAFIPFTDMLLMQQLSWMQREDNDIVAGLREMSRRAGMSSADFDACMKKEDEAKRLADARDKAMKDYCIDGTPTLILNGKKLPLTAAQYEGLDGVLREEMKNLGLKAPGEPTAPAAEGKASPSEGEAAAPASDAPATDAPQPVTPPAPPQ